MWFSCNERFKFFFYVFSGLSITAAKFVTITGQRSANLQQSPHALIGLVGTFIQDEIIPLHDRPVASIGGLYHSLAYAAFLSGGAFRIRPVARVGENFYPVLRKAIAKLPDIDETSLIVARSANTKVTLKYISKTAREETTTSPMQPLVQREVASLAQARGILINMITGEDIALDALQWLASETGALLHLDFHTLALGRDDTGRRYYRKPPNWRKWVACADILQLNREEAAVLCGAPEKEHPAAYAEIVKTLLAEGPHGVLLTLGEQGVLAGFHDRQHAIQVQHCTPPIDQDEVVDIIGCGDAFGAAFFVRYLKDNDFFAAARFAVRIAAANTTFMGSLTPELFTKKIAPYATP